MDEKKHFKNLSICISFFLSDISIMIVYIRKSTSIHEEEKTQEFHFVPKIIIIHIILII